MEGCLCHVTQPGLLETFLIGGVDRKKCELGMTPEIAWRSTAGDWYEAVVWVSQAGPPSGNIYLGTSSLDLSVPISWKRFH